MHNLTRSNSFQVQKAKLLLKEYRERIKQETTRMGYLERVEFLLNEIEKISALNIELYEELLEKDKAIREVLAERLGFGKEYGEYLDSQSFSIPRKES